MKGTRPKEPPMPRTLPDDGLLIGWSMETRNRSLPMGFLPPRREGARARTRQPFLHTGGGHLMTIAPTGAGKGVGCIIPALLRHPGPVIVIDPKGENHAVTARRRRELGQRVVLLDPFNVTGERADAFNPLDLLSQNDPGVVDEAGMLADLLAPPTISDDPFWNNRARQAIHVLLLTIALQRPLPLRNLAELCYLLHQSENDLAYTVAELRRSSIDAISAGASILDRGNAENVKASYLSIAQDHVAIFGSSAVNRATAMSTFDVHGITRGDPLSLYIVLPPDKLTSHRHLLRIWIGALFGLILRRRKRVNPPTLFLLDEAAQLGPLPQLRQALTLLRGYGLQTWSFWQDLSQLQRLYPHDWSTMYNNCSVHQVFGITTMRLARSIAALNRTHAAQALLELEHDEMELSLAGSRPLIATRPSYLADPCFADQYDRNPMFGEATPPPPDHPPRIYDARSLQLQPSQEQWSREIEAHWQLGEIDSLEPETRQRLAPEYWLHEDTDGHVDIIERTSGGDGKPSP